MLDTLRFLKSFVGTSLTLMALILVVGGTFYFYGPRIAVGDEALELMTPKQRAVARQLLAFNSSTSIEAFNTLLGAPIEKTSERVRWKDPAAPDTAHIQAQLTDGKVFKLRYISKQPSWGWYLNASGSKFQPPGKLP